MLRTWTVDQQPEKERKTIEGDQGEPAKDFPTVKSVSLRLKYDKWMNGSVYLGLVWIGPFYREFGVGLFV